MRDVFSVCTEQELNAIRAQLHNYMIDHPMGLGELAKRMNLNLGTLRRFIKGENRMELETTYKMLHFFKHKAAK
jgi:hypothetical protein